MKINNTQKGFFNVVLIVIIIVIIVGAFYWFSNGPEMNTENEEMKQENEVGEMMENENIRESQEGYSGIVLAGNSSLLLDFTQEDYKKALVEDKLVALYFYANWCPICRAEFPKMEKAFDELQVDNVIGFRVNYNDNETDDFERGLAREFGVAYQHTKVFLYNGERVLKSPETWEKDRYLSEINKLLN